MMRLLDFKLRRKGTLRGFAKIRLPNTLIVSDVVLGEKQRKTWALFPNSPMINPDGNVLRDERGKIRYRPFIEWESRETGREFSRRVVELVRARRRIGRRASSSSFSSRGHRSSGPRHSGGRNAIAGSPVYANLAAAILAPVISTTSVAILAADPA
jgi:hypothetical protein